MNDHYATEPTTLPAPNPHDVAKAVLRPAIYAEAVDWLREMNPGLFEHNPGFKAAVDKLEARVKDAKAAPSADLLDHATAAYARKNAESLRNAGHDAAARLLEHVADDYDGGTDSAASPVPFL